MSNRERRIWIAVVFVLAGYMYSTRYWVVVNSRLGEVVMVDRWTGRGEVVRVDSR